MKLMHYYLWGSRESIATDIGEITKTPSLLSRVKKESQKVIGRADDCRVEKGVWASTACKLGGGVWYVLQVCTNREGTR